MTVVLERRRRVPQLHGWAVSLVAGLSALVATCEALARDFEVSPVTCPFRAVTGVPCATCGSTRAVLALLEGRVLDAFVINPLVMSVAAAVGAVVAFRFLTARQVVLHLTRRERFAAWALASAVFWANWAYVIVWHAGERAGL